MTRRKIETEQNRAEHDGQRRDELIRRRIRDEHKVEIDQLKAKLIGLGLQVGEPVLRGDTTPQRLAIEFPVSGSKTDEVFNDLDSNQSRIAPQLMPAEFEDTGTHGWVFSWTLKG